MLKILKGRKVNDISKFTSVFVEKKPFGVYLDGNEVIIYVKYFCEGFYITTEEIYQDVILPFHRCKKIKNGK